MKLDFYRKIGFFKANKNIKSNIILNKDYLEDKTENFLKDTYILNEKYTIENNRLHIYSKENINTYENKKVINKYLKNCVICAKCNIWGP